MSDQLPVPPTFTTRGSGRIGYVNFSWPFVTLSATKDSLEISTIFDSCSFSRSQVISLEKVQPFPLIGGGVRVVHEVPDYPERVIFWGGPDAVLAAISSVGFLPEAEPASIPGHRVSRGLPFRVWPLVAVVLAWNLLTVGDFLLESGLPSLPGPLSFIAVLLVLLLCLTALRFRKVQNVLLKPGRAFGEIRNVVILLAVITAVLALPLGAFALIAILR